VFEGFGDDIEMDGLQRIIFRTRDRVDILRVNKELREYPGGRAAKGINMLSIACPARLRDLP